MLPVSHRGTGVHTLNVLHITLFSIYTLSVYTYICCLVIFSFPLLQIHLKVAVRKTN